MHVVDIGGHLAVGYTYQIWFGTRPTKECVFFFNIKRRTENQEFWNVKNWVQNWTGDSKNFLKKSLENFRS